MKKFKIKYLNPLTDEQKVARMNAKGDWITAIEYLDPQEILNRYWNILSEEEKDALNIMIIKQHKDSSSQ